MLPFYLKLSQSRDSAPHTARLGCAKLPWKSSDGQNPYLYQMQQIEEIQPYPGCYTLTLISWLPSGDGPLWRNLTRPSDVTGCRGVMYSPQRITVAHCNGVYVNSCLGVLTHCCCTAVHSAYCSHQYFENTLHGWSSMQGSSSMPQRKFTGVSCIQHVMNLA